MAEIYEPNSSYNAFRQYVCWMFRHAYRHIDYHGMEHLPSHGAIIFAPNHTNGLCDALAILSLTNQSKVFVARADMFRQPRIAHLLRWLKILPIHRMRDGLESVRHNDLTIQQAVDTLRHDVPFCIMPEGTHRAERGLLPLNKGIFRIALAAQEQLGEEKNVYIVPVGIRYADFFHLWDRLDISIGEAIDICDYVHSHTHEDKAQQLLQLRGELTQRLQSLLLTPSCSPQPKNIVQWLRAIGLVILAPLFGVAAAANLPLLLVAVWARLCVEDKAFHNSLLLAAQILWFPWSAFLLYPLWLFAEEYLYQYRQLIAHYRC